MTAVLALLIGLAIIVGLWRAGHASIIDRGPLPGSSYPKWDEHSWGHLGGAFVVAFGVGLLSTCVAGFLVSLVLWSLVELAQAHPRDRLGGYADKWDLLWDLCGALGGMFLCFVVT